VPAGSAPAVPSRRSCQSGGGDKRSPHPAKASRRPPRGNTASVTAGHPARVMVKPLNANPGTTIQLTSA
jgi:hypothetical protein